MHFFFMCTKLGTMSHTDIVFPPQCPPPNIDFVLPSPTIGMPIITVIDPPWLPHFKSKVEEVTLNQEESVSGAPQLSPL